MLPKDEISCMKLSPFRTPQPWITHGGVGCKRVVPSPSSKVDFTFSPIAVAGSELGPPPAVAVTAAAAVERFGAAGDGGGISAVVDRAATAVTSQPRDAREI